jgi:hypothetical protein
MNITASSSLQSLPPLMTVSGVATTTPAQTVDSTAGVSQAGVSVNVSQPGQLMSQLKDLAASDPAKFKAVTAEIAQKLKDAAASQGGRGAAFLDKLADQFSAASQSGSASGLSPQHAHGHHHHGGGYNKQGSSTPASNGQGVDAIGQTIQGIISSALPTVTPAS